MGKSWLPYEKYSETSIEELSLNQKSKHIDERIQHNKIVGNHSILVISIYPHVCK